MKGSPADNASGLQQIFDFSGNNTGTATTITGAVPPAPTAESVQLDYLVDSSRRTNNVLLVTIALIMILTCSTACLFYKLNTVMEQNAAVLQTVNQRHFQLAKDYCARMYPAATPQSIVK